MKEKLLKMKHLLPASLLLVVILSGCGLLGTASSDEGTLILSLAGDSLLTAKTIEPTLDMTVATFDAYGVGPAGATFLQLGVGSSTVVQASLVFGDWTIDVDAKNASGTIVGQGTIDVTIAPGEVLIADVTVTPVVGTGTLDVEVNWPAGVLTSPAVTGTLAPAGGASAAAVFTLAGDALSADFVDASLDNGYYILTVQLNDGPVTVWSTVESVRIVAGEISEKAYALVEDVNRGGFDVTVIEELDNPVVIDFDTVDETVIFLGQSLTVTATTTPVDPEDGTFTYDWYFAGTPQGSTGKSVTVNGYLPGVHWLDLILTTTTTNGLVVSSSRIKIVVENDGAIAGALFVATSGLDSNAGTIESPMQTIAAAVAAAAATTGKDRILVSEGTYDGQVDLADGISIYGGYSAANGWAFSDLYTTTISNSSVASNGLFGVKGAGITTATVLSNLTITTGDTAAVGKSNYAVHLSNSSAVTLRALIVVAGNGGAGAFGSNGSNGSSGAAGGTGGAGNWDTGSYGFGGGGGWGPGYTGGGGGRGGGEGATWGYSGGSGSGPNGGGGGGGGQGGDPGRAGGSGGTGGNGAIGANGGGGNGGSVTSDYWTTSSGGNGTSGLPGSGGGGGGGGGGQGCFWCDDGSGNGGGGGGAGGTGGSYGTSGTGGGGSFGLFLVNSTGVAIENSSIASGNGGAGGNGGSGGSGGTAGPGGAGGSAGTSEIGAGGRGGNGGYGGYGGHGGGGSGGPSYSVYVAGTTVDLATVATSNGSGGAGGYSPGNSGATGTSGSVN